MTVRDPRLDPEAIADAARLLRAGELVGVPTETVYGLAGRALDPASIARIFAVKGRPPGHPLIAHVLDLDGARAVASDVEAARALAAAFWPGPLTFVLPRGAAPAELSGGLPTVAVRAPAHPIMRALIRELGEPIAAPSANRFQQLSPTTAAHVVQALGDAIPLVLDGGPCARGIESTVVDLCGPPAILRPGPISLEALRAIVPEIASATGSVARDAPRASPGLDPRHYAPRAAAKIFSGDPPARPGDGVLFCGALRSLAGVETIALTDEPEAYAAGLYAALHALDDRGCARIWIEDVPRSPMWDAVRDRITRATSTS